MKVGIVTIYDTDNMGNRLQNYALQQVLLQYADQVVTLRNKPASGSKLADWKRSSQLAEIPLLAQLQKNRRKAKILKFNHRYIRLTRKCYWYNRNTSELLKEDQCDLYCAGSDQIWNPHLERNDLFSFLGFAAPEQTFSYAASFGISQIPDCYTSTVRDGLNHVANISVREDAGQEIVRELTGRTDAQVLIDPTMLLTSKEWETIIHKPDAPLPQEYVLMYFLGNVSRERRDAIRAAAGSIGCPVLDIMDPDSPYYHIGPEEFLYLIRHARLVCTDSFHGSVFSFLWQRPLTIFARDGGSMGSRIKTFADTFHLEERIVPDEQIPQSLLGGADYTAGYAVLKEERKRSHGFISHVFSAAKNCGKGESQHVETKA